MLDGRLEDLLVDPDPADPAPRPEAIYRAVPGRPMKGLGGVIVDLGGGLSGFLRGPKLPAPGRPLLVQVSGWAEPGKAPPVTVRVLLKGRLAILTPGAPGINVARSLHDPERRARLTALAEAAMAGRGRRPGADPALGGRRRAGRGGRRRGGGAAGGMGGARGAGRPRAGAAGAGRRRRGAARLAGPGTPLRRAAGALADAGAWDEVETLRRPVVPLGRGSMVIEPTRALVAVDVNTGGDLSPAAALKANLAAAAELPRQLRLRGLGGQVAIDFAPLARADRPRVERALAAALRADGIDTTVAGWTPLGHLELQRKRARRPLPAEG